MALRPLLLSAVVGLAAFGVFHAPTAEARSVFSISVGTPAPYYGQGQYRPGYAWVPARWVSGYRGRALAPGHYVRVRAGYGNNRGYGYGARPIYRSAPIHRPVQRGYYQQRGPRRGW